MSTIRGFLNKVAGMTFSKRTTDMATPDTGDIALYPKGDKFYYKTSAGVVTELSAAVDATESVKGIVDGPLVRSLNSKFTTLAGTTSHTITSASGRNFLMNNPTAARTITITGTDFKAGDVVQLTLTGVTSSNNTVSFVCGSTIATIASNGSLIIMATVDGPDVSSEWVVLDYKKDVIVATNSGTVSSTNGQTGDLVIAMDTITSGYELLNSGIKIPVTGTYRIGFSVTMNSGTVAAQITHLHMKINNALYATNVYLGVPLITGNQASLSGIYGASYDVALTAGQYVTVNLQIGAAGGIFSVLANQRLTVTRL